MGSGSDREGGDAPNIMAHDGTKGRIHEGQDTHTHEGKATLELRSR